MDGRIIFRIFRMMKTRGGPVVWMIKRFCLHMCIANDTPEISESKVLLSVRFCAGAQPSPYRKKRKMFHPRRVFSRFLFSRDADNNFPSRLIPPVSKREERIGTEKGLRR